MKIVTLIQESSQLSLFKAIPESEIDYISADSRQVEANDIFCVYNSFSENTSTYLHMAKQRGVKTVLIDKNSPHLLVAENFSNVILASGDPMFLHGSIASHLKKEPSQKLKIIAVTGTNGKTSFTYILGDIIARKKKYGIIGTIQVSYGNKVINTGYTTPDPSSLNRILQDMLADGVEYVFMEASSHGLKLGRLHGIHFYGAVFTNLSQDHLDFHSSMEDYLDSKFILFQHLESSNHKNKFAVISTYSQGGRNILSRIRKDGHKTYDVIGFGKGKAYSGELLDLALGGTSFCLHVKKQASIQLFTNLLGEFNYENVCLAYIAAIQLGMEAEELEGILKNLKPVDGRFQIVYGKNKSRAAIVDYAHTPDALENVLKSLQAIPHSRLICLFGCGGDRDRGKRPLMGEVAVKYADMLILTSDNPRSEDPEQILDDITKGIPETFPSVLRIANRKQAILKGIQILPDRGFLLVAGKGHENYQIIGAKKESFSDTIEIQQAFAIDESSRR
ncbi:MAG: UDP-N-acetylmuramoyl-L-alanyl-D-glutamate--2,6-diaminopimelate ligase [Spirochaetota bacterium]